MVQTKSRQSRYLTDDATLIDALRRGDNVATETFVRANSGWMLAAATRILRNRAAAEDAVQSAFANIFAKLDQFRGEAGFTGWMRRIVANQALMGLRAERRRQETGLDEFLPEFDNNDCRIEDRWTDLVTPEALLQKVQMRAIVIEAIGRLPDSYRVVLMLRDIEEFDTAEVAALLAITPGAVKTRLHRARAALKNLLEPLLRGQEP
jgi:RNA polymerase sigma-70 factor (ECF subfamily)